MKSAWGRQCFRGVARRNNRSKVIDTAADEDHDDHDEDLPG